MGKDLMTRGTPVLYQNRYCDQENFDLVISAAHHYKVKFLKETSKIYIGNISKIEYPSFLNA